VKELVMRWCFVVGVVSGGVFACSGSDAPTPSTSTSGAPGMGGTAGTAGSGGASTAGQSTGGSLNTSGTSGTAGASAGGGTGGAGGAASGGGGGGGASGGGAGGSGGSGGSGGAPVGLADFQLYGRWDLRTAGKAITVNSGSHVTASFEGTGISAKFDISGNTGERPTVSFRIDGGELIEKEISPTLELVAGLPTGKHELILFVRGMSEFEQRWTPPLVASTVFLGFSVTGGALVSTARPQRLKLEFLGDSITEGVLVHDKGPAGQNTAPWRCDGARNYAALTAQKLGVEWRQVGFGRQGLTVGGNGGVPKAQQAFDWFYSRAPRDAWQADVVVINQGTNDRGTASGDFASLYKSFLGIVRAGYPNAKIVALRPLVGDFGTEIAAEVKARKDGGDSKVYYVDTGGWTSSGDFTDGLHPNLSGSAKIADKLAAALMPIIQ
jgi:lysophospholipase L1-like esterase